MSSSNDSEKLIAGEHMKSPKIMFSMQQLLEIGERLGYRSCRTDANWRRRNKQQKESQETYGGVFSKGKPGAFSLGYSQNQKLGSSSNTLQSSSWKGGSAAVHGKSFSRSSPTDDLWDVPKEGDGDLFDLANPTLEYERKEHYRKHNIVSLSPSPSSAPLHNPDPPSIPRDALKSTSPPLSVQYPGHSASLPIPTPNGDDSGQPGNFSENSNTYINDAFASLWASKAQWLPGRETELPRVTRLSQRSERSNSMILPSGDVDPEEFYNSVHSHARPTHFAASDLESKIDLMENIQLKHPPPVYGSNSAVPLPPGLASNYVLSASNCMNLGEIRGLAFEKALTHNVLGPEGGIRDGETAALKQQSGSCTMNGYSSVLPPPPGLVIPKQQKPSQELDQPSIILNDIAPVEQPIVSRRINHQVPVQASTPQQELNSVEKINLSSSSPPRNPLSELHLPTTTHLQPLSSTSPCTPKQKYKLQEKTLPSSAIDVVKTLGLSSSAVPEASAKESDGRLLDPKSATSETGDRGSQKFTFHSNHRAPYRKTNLSSSSLKSLPDNRHPQRVIAQKSSSKPLQRYTNNIRSVPHQLLKKMLEDKQPEEREWEPQ